MRRSQRQGDGAQQEGERDHAGGITQEGPERAAAPLLRHRKRLGHVNDGGHQRTSMRGSSHACSRSTIMLAIMTKNDDNSRTPSKTL